MLRRGLILLNGSIYTFDPTLPRAKAMLVLDGRVEYCGDDLDPAEMGIDTKQQSGWMTVIDLEGKTVLPGFVDSHTHLNLYAKSLREVDLRLSRSLAAVTEAVAVKVGEQKKGVWILGRGWNRDRWTDGGLPHRRHLDAIAPHHPVLLRCHDEHTVWANTLAMKVAGVGRDTPDPSGGKIVRDASGDLTGIFKERAASLLSRVVPESSPGLQRDLMANALREIVRRGVTAVYDHDGAQAFQLLAELQGSGLLPLRVTESFRVDSLDGRDHSGIVAGFGNEFLRMGGVKVFLDGALSSRTGWMWEPYADGSGTGQPIHDEKERAAIVAKAMAARVPLVFHAIGDRAVSTALDMVEEFQRKETGPRIRHRIEHAQTVRPEDLPRFQKLDVVASMQPVHLLDDVEAAHKALGSRIANTFAARKLMDAGANVAFGSDLPIAPFDPMIGIYAATQRRRPDGTPKEGFALEQAVSVEEAIRAYTCNGAAALGIGERLGRLSEGFAADCVVLSADPFTCAPEELLGTHVEMTIVDGRVVYDRRGMPRKETI